MKKGLWEDFSKSELRQLKALKSPEKIQDFLNKIPYHLADTCWSPRKVLQQKTAHCLEGAIFAACALRFHGFEPLILDLEAEADTDHVICVFRRNNAWGAIATSNYSGCRYRSSVYKSLRELALSYFEDYFNLRRERSLRTFSKPVNLKKFDPQNWMSTEQDVWFIPEYLLEIPHTQLLSPAMKKNLVRLDKRSFEAGALGRRLPRKV
jgi:hypothetical protein